MYCEDASTSGNHLTRRLGFTRGESRDRNRWNVYCRVPVQLFLLILRRATLLLHVFVRQNVHLLTAATFDDWLSPRAQAHYHKSRTNTIGLNDDNCLITAMVESRLQYYGFFPKFQREGSSALPSPTYIFLVMLEQYN